MVFLPPSCRTVAVALAVAAGVVTTAAAQSDGSPSAAARLGRPFARPAQGGASIPTVPLKELVVNGAHYFTEGDIAAYLHLRVGAPLPASPAALADDLQHHYSDHGYSFALVAARFDQTSGRLSLDVDEGHIDAIEFAGVPDAMAHTFTREFSLQPGDVFRRAEAGRALSVLLQPTDGAVRPVESTWQRDTERLPPWQRAFEMVDRGGKRVLIVHLTTRRNQFNLAAGTEGREDWFDPVDGLAPAIGFNDTIFDAVGFNHTYLAGYLSYKFGRDAAGYSIGFERPFFGNPRLFVGAELHDQTASDDQWRVSPTEQGLASSGFKASFRDYYERRGYQLNAAVRFGPSHEVLGAWRDERQEPLLNTSDFSVFRGDRTYRANQLAEAGRLHALVVGYTWDSRGLRDESHTARYERHQLADLFGSSGGDAPGWRVEWTSEIAAPALGGDFDYRRHVLNARRYNRLLDRHVLNLRAIVAIGEGNLPPQRLPAIGGTGSIPGYEFKEAVGERMILFDAEYKYLLDHNFKPLVLFDTGRVVRPIGLSRDDWMQALGAGIEFGESGWRSSGRSNTGVTPRSRFACGPRSESGG